jgi:hypothetical protein
LKRPNMALEQSEIVEAGSRAVLTGLQNKPELNNHVVVVVRYLNDQGRYKVKPVGKEARHIFRTPHLAVRPANLKLIPPSAFLLDNRKPDEGGGLQGNILWKSRNPSGL